MTMYLVLPAMTSIAVYLIATTKDSAFSFTVCTLPPNILTPSAQTKPDVYRLVSSHSGLPEPA
jgi:hypothetical protein